MPSAFGGGVFHSRIDASYVRPRSSQTSGDESAFEVGLGEMAYLDSEQAFELGPHASFLQTWGSSQDRHSIYVGMGSSLWIMNAIAPGFEVDYVAQSALPNDRYRVEPMLDTRVIHLGDNLALALRIGVPYEETLLWGFRAGLTFEFLGI